MNTRTLLVVAAIVVVLSLLAVFSHNFGSSGSSQTQSLLAPDLKAQLNDVDVVAIKGAGDEAVDLESHAGKWVVEQRDEYPADVGMIRKALLALADAKIVEEKTSNPDYYDRLGVENVANADASGVALSLSGDDVDFPTLILGNAEGTQYRYVRRSDEARSYMIDANPDMPADPAKWLVKRILDVQGSRIAEVTITHSDGEVLRIFKDDSSQSNFSVDAIPEGRELQYPGVANVVANTLRELDLEDVARNDPGAFVPDTVSVYRTFDGLLVTARGAKIDGEGWLTFEAAVDANAPAAQTADETQAGDEAQTPANDAQTSADDAQAAKDSDKKTPQEEAAAINATVMGWQYRIASYKYDQMTRRMADLLSAPKEKDDSDSEPED